MSVDLLPVPTAEQAMVLDASARFIGSAFPLSTVRSRVDGGDDAPDAGYRKAAADLGWFGLLAGESISGEGLLDAALIAAERGASLQPGPFVGHSVVVDTLTAHGHPLVPALAGGDSWATWALASESLALDDEVLRGSVGPIPEAADCDWLLVSVGDASALVATDAPGVSVRRADGLDLTRQWFTVTFRETPAVVLDGSLDRQLQVAAVLSAAEAVGAMHAVFALTVEYARTRIAFGRPIGSFQAIKHLLADTSLWLEMSKAIVVAAASSTDPSLAHAAKSFVGERGAEVAQNCFQVFGGIGFTWEHDQHLYLRRLAAEAVVFGSPAWHRARILRLGGVR